MCWVYMKKNLLLLIELKNMSLLPVQSYETLKSLDDFDLRWHFNTFSRTPARVTWLLNRRFLPICWWMQCLKKNWKVIKAYRISWTEHALSNKIKWKRGGNAFLEHNTCLQQTLIQFYILFIVRVSSQKHIYNIFKFNICLFTQCVR